MDTDEWGIARRYCDAENCWHEISAETQQRVLQAMGVGPADRPQTADPVRVLRSGEQPALGSGSLTLEDGTTLAIRDRLPPDMPLGYHRFVPDGDGQPVLLIVSPGKCRLPPTGGHWCWAAQLYAVRSAESWGIGDLGDLRRLARWSAGQGAGLLLINPLGAVAPRTPQQSSPYYPGSRRFRNPLYLRIEEVPGAAKLGDELTRLAAAGQALNQTSRIDRDAIFALKQQALERLWPLFGGDKRFDQYCREQGAELEQFAAFCTLNEQLGPDWHVWPSQYRRPDSPAIAAWINEHRDRVRYHQWLQWLIDEQLARASAEISVMHDLPIGVDPGGADAWAWQDILAQGCSVGAPPDMYNTQGQDWGLPPFIPHKLRECGYQPVVKTLRAVLRHAGALRIDHVMGLFRLFWIPHGMGPRHGAFVRYKADELLAIVALESHRAGAFVVGEDLGTVEMGVREQLAERNVLSYRLLWFETTPPREYPQLAMVAVTTHDLPTIAGLWSGEDLAAQERIGLKPSAAAMQQIKDRLAQGGGLPGDTPTEKVIERAYMLLAESPSLIVAATLEDALAVPERTNMPGTVEQWPNWSIPLPGGVEALEASPLAARIAAVLNSRAASKRH
jgi:4-alpha-glucanotransferase